MPPLATPHPLAPPALAPQVFELGRAVFDWSGLTPMHAASGPSTADIGVNTQRSRPGARLLQDMARELPSLSPKLRRVAQYCIIHASTLHLCRIQDVAAASDTVPASVVRLAQRLGLHGFQELKLAFIDLAPGAPASAATPDHAPRSVDTSAQRDRAVQRALLDLDESAQALATLRTQVQAPAFDALVHALRTARHIRFDWAGEADRTVALHLQARLRALGCHQVGASKAGAGHRGEWLVQVAVCEDKACGGRALDTARFGPQVLRLVRGRATPANSAARRSSPADDATLIRCGNDPRRILTALAVCELLAAALAPERAGADS